MLLLPIAPLVAACGDDDGDDRADTGDATTTTGSDDDADTTTTAEPATPEELAIAAYVRGWEVEFKALDPPNPMHPELGEVFTGDAAQSIGEIIVNAKNAGQRHVGSMQTNPTVASSTSEKVLLKDCTVEQSTTYDASGAVVDQGTYPPRSREIEVVNQDGTWRVSVIRTLEEPCTPA
jgi:hypothetical protein